jgi:integrase
VETVSEKTPGPSESQPIGEVTLVAPEPDAVSREILREMPFPQAAKLWLESRRPYLAAKTFREYGSIIRTLTRSFGKMRLPEITADQIRAYQRARMATCGPSGINHETSCLQQMLKRIGRWPEIGPDFQPVPRSKSTRGRALSGEEYDRLFRVAASNANWRAAYLFAVISVNTTAGPKEVATLRVGDVTKSTIRIQPEGAKNADRVRTIPLNDLARNALAAVIERANRLGSVLPEHYLFPYRERKRGRNYDPVRHQTTFKTAWREMIGAADLPGLRMYDLRHHAITMLLENPEVSEETAEQIAGHITHQMKKQYSHVRLETKRTALDALLRAHPPVTKNEKPRNPKGETMRNPDVLTLLAAGLSPAVVIEKIKASACEFDISTQVLQELKAAVPDRVILAMLKQRS